jgi:hypothetical protein
VTCLGRHPDVTDVLVTGGDPMIMSTERLRSPWRRYCGWCRPPSGGHYVAMDAEDALTLPHVAEPLVRIGRAFEDLCG